MATSRSGPIPNVLITYQLTLGGMIKKFGGVSPLIKSLQSLGP